MNKLKLLYLSKESTSRVKILGVMDTIEESFPFSQFIFLTLTPSKFEIFVDHETCTI